MNRNRFVVLAILPFLLSGCNSMPSWMGGKKVEKQKIAGERIAVLPVDASLQPEDSLKDKPVTVPSASANEEWPQHTGIFNESSSNLAVGALTRSEHVEVGEGDEFDEAMAIRPVVGGGLVFAMDATGHISAHNAANIENIRWKSKGVVSKHEPKIGGGGLAYAGGRLYATSGRGIVAAFDAATGKQIWRKDLHVPFRSAPVIAAEKLFAITLDNQVYALSAADGEIAWNQRGIRETTGLLNSVSPVVAGDAVIVPYSSGEIYVHSIADGKEIWSESLSADKRTQASSIFAGIGGDPVIDGSVIIAVSSGGQLSVMAVASGQHAWDKPVGATNTPWVSGDFLYVLSTDNTLICFLKFDGRIKWSTKLPGFENEAEKKDAITWKGPVMVSGKLAVVSSNGQLFLINASDGKIATTLTIPEHVYAAPVVAGGRMYLVTQDAQLVALH